MDSTVNNRSCISCNKVYPKTKQYFDPRYSGRKRGLLPQYLSNTCRDCNKNKRILYREKNKEKIKAYGQTQRLRRKDKKSCKKCSKPRMQHSLLCELHWYGTIAYNAGLRDSIEDGKLLKEIMEKQRYTCPYSGEKLVPGVNCSLDHIKPKSRFPLLTTDISNMEWTTKLVNRSKYDMTKEEYYLFIEKILKNRVPVEGTYITPITIT